MLTDQQRQQPLQREAEIVALLWKVAASVSVFFVLMFLVSLGLKIQEMQSVQGSTDPIGFWKHLDNIELCYHRAVWLAVSLLACALALAMRWPMLWMALICAIVIELVSMRAHWALLGRRFSPLPPLVHERFIHHPLLQVVPKPGSFGIYTHTQDNSRLTINPIKTEGASRVSAYGGSTTYEFVKDGSTWPSVLSTLLGPNFTVANRGVLGYSSVEHIVQVSFDFRADPPRCALFYVGWNDLRSSHTEDIRADYTNFHLAHRARDLGLDARRNIIVRRSAFASILQITFGGYSRPKGNLKADYDLRLSNIYASNIKLIAAISKHFGVKPIFVPQVLNYSFRGNWRDWMPFVPGTEVEHLMGAMNADLRKASHESDAIFIEEVLDGSWSGSDFIDAGHFSEAGSKKFASLIAGTVAKECASPMRAPSLR